MSALLFAGLLLASAAHAQERLPPPVPLRQPIQGPRLNESAASPNGAAAHMGPPPAGQILTNPSVLNLAQATELALRSSPMLQTARANVEEARGQAIQARLYPNVRYDAGGPNQIAAGANQLNVGLTQTIVRGGKLHLSTAAAEQAVQQSQLAFARQHYELLAAVRRQFYIVLTAQERARSMSELRSIAEQSLVIGDRLLQAGQGTETDVLLLRIEMRRLEAASRTADLAVTSGTQQLAAILGVPNLKIDRLAGSLAVRLPDFDDNAARQQLLWRNSQLQSARVDIGRNRLLLDRAIAEPVPNLDVTAGWQYNVNGGPNPALLGVNFDIPIWNRNQGNIRTATWNVTEAVAQASVVENDLLRQLADALARYRSAQRQVVNFEQSMLPDARRAQELVQLGYEQGQFDLVRLLQAQQFLFQTNLDYLSAEQERLTAAADLYNLLQIENFP